MTCLKFCIFLNHIMFALMFVLFFLPYFYTTFYVCQWSIITFTMHVSFAFSVLCNIVFPVSRLTCSITHQPVGLYFFAILLFAVQPQTSCVVIAILTLSPWSPFFSGVLSLCAFQQTTTVCEP